MIKLILSLVVFSSLAQAATYKCGDLKLSISEDASSVTVSGLQDDEDVVGAKTAYKPTAAHAGATRYDISSMCSSSGSIYAILDKKLSTGESSGQLTIQSTCDADGGGPSYDIYKCQAE